MNAALAINDLSLSTDLDRIENMTLRNIAGDYFRLDTVNIKDEEDDDE